MLCYRRSKKILQKVDPGMHHRTKKSEHFLSFVLTRRTNEQTDKPMKDLCSLFRILRRGTNGGTNAVIIFQADEPSKS